MHIAIKFDGGGDGVGASIYLKRKKKSSKITISLQLITNKFFQLSIEITLKMGKYENCLFFKSSMILYLKLNLFFFKKFLFGRLGKIAGRRNYHDARNHCNFFKPRAISVLL